MLWAAALPNRDDRATEILEDRHLDLAAGSTAFASIVSLLGQFLDQRRVSQNQTMEEFKAWLSRRSDQSFQALTQHEFAELVRSGTATATGTDRRVGSVHHWIAAFGVVLNLRARVARGALYDSIEGVMPYNK